MSDDGAAGVGDMHGQERPLTAAEIAQIPPERLRAIIAAGLAREAWRNVAEIEARLLGQSDDANDESME